MGSLSGTVDSIHSFTEGFRLFNQSYTTAMDNQENASHFLQLLTADPDFIQSEVLLTFALDNASDAWTDIEVATMIASSVKTSWQNLLYYPGPPTLEHYYLDSAENATVKSIAGLSLGMLDTIDSLKAAADLAQAEEYQDLIQTYFEYMETLDLSAIFGGG